MKNLESTIFDPSLLELDEIVEIIECEEEETLDIKMSNLGHLFFANGVLTHNSGYDSTELNMGHIAESAGLSHTADIIYGIIQDSTMHVNNEYWLKILKVRNGSGKNSRCLYQIDYSYMRLNETDIIIS
jgi:hypothetical protein